MSKPKILTLFDENVEGSIYSKLNNPVTVTLTNRSLVVSGVVDVQDNSILTFKPGCSSTEVDSITINGKVYTIKDSSGNVVNGNSDTWSGGVVISVALDTADREAYILSSNFKTIGDHVSNKNNPHNVTADQLGALKKSGGTMTGAINMGNKSITSLKDPVNDYDAANKKYVDANTSDLETIDILLNYSNIVSLKVVNSNNAPIQGVTVEHMKSLPETTAITGSDGIARGVVDSKTVTLKYFGIEKQVDISNIIGVIEPTTVVISLDGRIVEYKSSATVVFPSTVTSVDLCVVGGGGGGAGCHQTYNSASGNSYNCGMGGTGGTIVNSYNISVTPGTEYSLIIGAGGSGGSGGNDNNNAASSGVAGGTSSFLGVSAAGGPGGVVSKGGGPPKPDGVTYNGGPGGRGASGYFEKPGRGTAGSNSTLSAFEDGITFYSGGGGGGGGSSVSGGSPYGGSSGQNGTGPGGGGGGGNYPQNGGGSGSSGIILIKLHE